MRVCWEGQEPAQTVIVSAGATHFPSRALRSCVTSDNSQYLGASVVPSGSAAGRAGVREEGQGWRGKKGTGGGARAGLEVAGLLVHLGGVVGAGGAVAGGLADDVAVAPPDAALAGRAALPEVRPLAPLAVLVALRRVAVDALFRALTEQGPSQSVLGAGKGGRRDHSRQFSGSVHS